MKPGVSTTELLKNALFLSYRCHGCAVVLDRKGPKTLSLLKPPTSITFHSIKKQKNGTL